MREDERQQRFRECHQEMPGVAWRIARTYARDSDLDDLVQEIWVQVWNALPSFRAEAKLSTWFYTVALRTALTYRRKAWCQARPADLDTVPEAALPTADPERGEDVPELLRQALQSLNFTDRALVLLWLEGLAYRDIARVVGSTESAIGVRLNRLREKLRRQLEPIRDER